MTLWLLIEQVVVKVSGISLYVEPQYRKMLLYRCIAGFACMGFAFYAMSQMVLADAASLIFVSPVLTFFFVRLPLRWSIEIAPGHWFRC
jgi:drug/metabolite transporter (DMT)-like permease